MSPTTTSNFSHLDERGQMRMVDVSGKGAVARRAVAEGWFLAQPATLDAVLKAGGGAALPKGDAFAAARIAGIQAAKRCDELIPLCHGLPLDHVGVEFERTAPDRLRITATASTTARTGVEMEALLAVSLAALTLWDMTKAIDATLRIDGITLLEKTKGAGVENQSMDGRR